MVEFYIILNAQIRRRNVLIFKLNSRHEIPGQIIASPFSNLFFFRK